MAYAHRTPSNVRSLLLFKAKKDSDEVRNEQMPLRAVVSYVVKGKEEIRRTPVDWSGIDDEEEPYLM